MMIIRRIMVVIVMKCNANNDKNDNMSSTKTATGQHKSTLTFIVHNDKKFGDDVVFW